MASGVRNGGPKVEFDQQVPYDQYVRATTLHSLQRPVTSDPGEMSFLMISQVMELYFGLIRFELQQIQDRLRADDVWGALAPIRRASLHLDGLNAAWRGLGWMTPVDFQRFREQLGEASGFQSAMYRHLEMLLGLKSATLIRPFKRQRDVYQALTDGLAAPSLWDDVVALLGRRGYAIPQELVDRDFAAEYEPSAEVEAAWVKIYHDDRPDNELRLLGEALTDLVEKYGHWRDQHVTAVRRTMGAKAGSGGSSGLAWLQNRAAQPVFPELWSARTEM
ncbi:tryptophan 2,3-dioxygenase [Natronosporangium hydrolyticum]|nr:tryptophan 2,3-dioxygenase family protein [Natronosporangium hydrolyticum]